MARTGSTIHVTSGVGPPTEVPVNLGDMYINTATGSIYTAIGVGDLGDWKIDAVASGTVDWGDILGTLTDQTDLANALNLKVDTATLALVATSGDYNDLSNKPDLSALNDVSIHADLASFPGTGDSDSVYIAEDSGFMYRWNGSGYTQLTDQTAIWGQISGTLSNQTDLQAALDGKLSEVVNDTSPQLGGQLDAQGNGIFDPGILTFRYFNGFSTVSRTLTMNDNYLVTGSVNGIVANSFSASAFEVWANGTAPNISLNLRTKGSGVVQQNGLPLALQSAVDAKADASQVLTNVPVGAVFTDTQLSDAQAETAYNNQVPVVSQGDAESGTSTTVYRWTPQRIAQAIAALAIGGGGLQNNFAATTNPGVSDDTNAGYSIGSTWINTTLDEAYRCVDASAGAAVWVNTTLTSAELATVGLTGEYADLLNKPTIFDNTTSVVNFGNGLVNAVVQSNGDVDLVLQTGNVISGLITIADGPNGDILLMPNGVGSVGINNATPTHKLDITVDDGDNQSGININIDDTTNNPVGLQINSAVVGGSDLLRLVGTDSNTTGPALNIVYNPTTPNDGDTAGLIYFSSKNSIGQETVYARIRTDINDITDGTEDASLSLAAMSAGSLTNFFTYSGASNTLTIGTGSSTTIRSNGNSDLVLQTGNITTGNITIVDGANGNIQLDPNGTGKVTINGNEIDETDRNSRASTATLTPTAGAGRVEEFVTALAANLTIAAPTGTAENGDSLLIRIRDNGTTRTLTWNATYAAIGVTLPTATTANKTIYVGCKYNSTQAQWDVIAVTEEA